MVDRSDALAFAHGLADLADAITLPAFRAGLSADTKDDGTPVTSADIGTERTLREAIRQRFPDHAVLGEEDGRDGPTTAPTWVIDPIDGTKNFIRGIPVFATLIALLEDDAPVIGVVSAPALGSRWDGVPGEGAHHNGDPIRVSSVATLAEGQVSLGGLNYFHEAGHAGFVGRVSLRAARQRGFGDFWQHCLVASGAVEAAVEAAVSLWDLAAIQAVVEGAGGRFTDLSGTATADGGSAISSNGLVHDEVLALVADDVR